MRNPNRLREGIRIANHLANKYSDSVYPEIRHEELISFAYLGVAKSLANYKPKIGRSFVSYTFLCVNAAIIDAFREHDHLGRTQRKNIREGKEPPVALYSLNPVHVELIDKKNKEPALALELNNIWEFAKEKLSHNDYNLLSLYYREGYLLKEMAALMGCSRQWVHMEKAQVLRTLRGLLDMDAKPRPKTPRMAL